MISLDELHELREVWRRTNTRFVLTNGVFDLLHSGHVGYLQQARALGDVLVVAINSDASTRAIKGPLRPLTPQDDRAAVLAALRYVDYVAVFDDRTAEHVVATLRPDVYVKGGDYASDDGPLVPDESRLPEAHIVRSYGGDVVLIAYKAGRSTSELIARIVERYANNGS